MRLEAVRSVAMRHVDYEYEAGRPVLRDISFEVPAGESVGPAHAFAARFRISLTIDDELCRPLPLERLTAR